MQRLKNIAESKSFWVWMVLGVMVIAGLTHGVNMLRFPYFENDEGIYVSQGWSAFNLGKLSPYTYWYDHAPAGWILIGLWQRLSGGVFKFGMAVASGRVLMWLIHLLVSAGLIYLGKKISGKWITGILAVLFFSLSPLAIYYQRRVLLDNVCVLWVVTSLVVLINKPLKIWQAAGAAAIAGLAVLSKEVAIFFIPAWLFVLWVNSRKNRVFVITTWLTVFGLVVSIYFLFAWLKGEFWPSGFLGDTTQRVSLVDTIGQQMGRGLNYPFWDSRSLFYQNWQDWTTKDPTFIWGCAVVTLLAGVLAVKWKRVRIPAVFIWSFAIFLLRSKLIIDFYIIPMIPFVSLGAGVILGEIENKIKNDVGKVMLIVGAIGLAVWSMGLRNIGQYTKDENKPLTETVDFLKKVAKPDDLIVADSSIYLDLKLARFAGDKKLTNVQWAWKIEGDDEIRKDVMGNDWRNIKYLAVSHEMLKQVRDFNASTIKAAVDNSDELAMFVGGSTAYLDLHKYLSTNGDWMGVLRVKNQTSIVLDNAWAYYKQNFIHDYGQVIDPQTGNTTSEGQAYAMLRAVWENDNQTFDGVWAWTRDHMQYRNGDKLLSWLWVKQDEKYVLGDFASASDADIDTALALLEAGKKWQNEGYISQAREIVKDIWRKEVVAIGNTYYLVAGSDAKREDGYLINPSYFSPAAYRIFAQVDPDDKWSKLANDTYVTWNKTANAIDNTSGLVPDWLWISEKSGIWEPADSFLGRKGSKYGYDAFRAYFRAAMDLNWYGTNEAYQFLSRSGQFFVNQWKVNDKVYSEYELNGQPVDLSESISTSVGALETAEITDAQVASQMYDRYFDETKTNNFLGYWGQAENYYDQNWAWFAVAFRSERITNYW